MIDIDTELRSLVDRGFKFAYPTDSVGDVVAVAGVRVHDGVIDIVQLYGEHDADAVRIPGDETDIFFPRTVLWRSTGAAPDVVRAMLELDDEPGAEEYLANARTRVSGTWVPVGSGRSHWLTAVSA